MITFEEARQIAAASDVLRGWSDTGLIEIAEWGWENSRDYFIDFRPAGEPWAHELPPEEEQIPGLPMVVVSKTTGELRTFIGAQVPMYYEDTDEESTEIGNVPDELSGD